MKRENELLLLSFSFLCFPLLSIAFSVAFAFAWQFLCVTKSAHDSVRVGFAARSPTEEGARNERRRRRKEKKEEEEEMCSRS